MYRAMVILVFISILFTGCMSVKRANRYYTSALDNNLKVDAVIVPGLAFQSKKNWSTLMERRVLWAWILYKNGITKHIIFSGGAVYTPFYESYVMGLYAQKLGVPRSSISYDTTAQHSAENVYYSYLIAKKKGFKSIALCTDRYQSTFLRRMLKPKFRTTIHLLPVVKDSVDKYILLEPKIDTNRAMVRRPGEFKSIRQRVPMTKRIRGTFGFLIPWKKHPGRKVEAL